MTETVVVEKTMTLSHTEFVGSMRHLTPAPFDGDATSISLETGFVRIGYRAGREQRLGGLLTLPQAVVTLTFIGVADAVRCQFLARFDRVFQRGGG